MGDMTTRMRKQDVDEVVGGFGERVLNDNGERLICMCK